MPLNPTPLPPCRTALVGVSGYARIHLEILQRLQAEGALALTAAVVINPESEAATVRELERQGCRIFSSLERMLAATRGRIDLCCVPTGIHWHAPMTLAALEAGAHVLVEKPLAATMEEVGRVRQKERETGRFVVVGFQDIHAAANQQIKDRLVGGAIGRLRRIRGLGLWPREAGYYRRNEWAGRIRVGSAWVYDSPINNAFAHFLNLALFFAGEKREEAARPARVEAELYRAYAIENFDTAALRIRTQTDVEITFCVSHVSAQVFEPELVIEGDAGTLTWRHAREATLEPGQGPSAVFPLPSEPEARVTMFRAVVKKVADPGAFACSTAIAAEHVRCVTAAQAAAGVHTIPAAACVSFTDPGSGASYLRVPGLDAVALAAFQAGKLFSEVGAPWGAPGGQARAT